MDIVMLAAGTSSRMGKTNKMLIPINGEPMVCHCCLQALKYLETRKESSKLIVVTGYYSQRINKALKPCKDYLEKTSAPIKLVIVKNKDYRKGQFSSTRVGVGEVGEGPFFISLADMPDITKQNYLKLENMLENFDAVRPFVKENPGHPVLLSNKIKQLIIPKPDEYTVAKILKTCKVKEPSFEDGSWTRDIDFSEDI